MKNLVLLFVVLFPSSVFAAAFDRCTIVSPKWPELVDGVNAEAICRETIDAVKGSYQQVPEGETLTITTEQRDTYHVLLWIQWTAPYPSGNYQGHAVLSWSPDGTYVDLWDKPSHP